MTVPHSTHAHKIAADRLQDELRRAEPEAEVKVMFCGGIAMLQVWLPRGSAALVPDRFGDYLTRREVLRQSPFVRARKLPNRRVFI